MTFAEDEEEVAEVGRELDLARPRRRSVGHVVARAERERHPSSVEGREVQIGPRHRAAAGQRADAR